MADEKFDEKELEKHDEKTEEKSWEEKWQRDPLISYLWAAIFIWAGLVFLASNLGLLDWILAGVTQYQELGLFGDMIRAWPLVLVGAGVILLFGVLLRILIPAYHRPIWGLLILSIILIGLGLGSLINWGVIWAVVLIILGIAILTRGFRRRE